MGKRILVVLALLFSCILIASQALGAERVMTLKIGKGQALVSVLSGTAQVHPAGKPGWRSLKVNEYLQGGDEVTTGSRSRLELVLPDNSRVRFADNSRFKVMQIEAASDSRNVRINVAVGRTWANVARAVGGKSRFELSCENAVAGVRGTVYRMNVNDDSSALVRVYDGEVAVSGGGQPLEKPTATKPPVLSAPTKVSGPNKVEGPKKISMEEWVYLVRSMQQISISRSGVPDKPNSFTEQEDRDEWVDWNRVKDAEY
jgi:ferric-dicitrate binding protein FerR (iron transport regulator)